MIYLSRAASVLFVIALPLLFICSGVTYAFNELRLYEYGFGRYEIAQRTGITDQGLMDSARTIRGYFNSPSSPLELKAEVHGREQELFTPRELAHMADVKRLLWGVYGVGAGAMAYLLAFSVLRLAQGGRGYCRRLGTMALWGSQLTIGLVVAVGLFSLVGFDSLFLWFHQVSFSNDFWRLDPNRHFLVMMFPQGFWLDATLFVGILAVGQAALLAVACGVGLKKDKLLVLWQGAKAKVSEAVKGKVGEGG